MSSESLGNGWENLNSQKRGEGEEEEENKVKKKKKKENHVSRGSRQKWNTLNVV